MIHLNSMNVYYKISTKHWILVVNTFNKFNNIKLHTKRFQWHTNTYGRAEIEKKMHNIFFIYIFSFRGKGGGQCIKYMFDLFHTSSDS